MIYHRERCQGPRAEGKYKSVSEVKAMGFDPERDLRIQEGHVSPIKTPGPKLTATSKAIEDRVIALIKKIKVAERSRQRL